MAFSLAALLLSYTCQAQTVGSAGVPLSTPVGSFIPSNDVTNEVRISETAKIINDFLMESNFDAAKNEYMNSGYLMVWQA